MLTINDINQMLGEEIEKASLIYPIQAWSHPPISTVNLYSSKTELGLASTFGQISINKLFIGTDAVSLLRNTIAHEISHLIVGVNQGHNQRFKYAASRLNVKSNSDFPELDVIKSKINYKYTVVAHLRGGEVVNLGGVHRKTRKYTDYNEQPRKNIKVQSVPVEWFEFIENERV